MKSNHGADEALLGDVSCEKGQGFGASMSLHLRFCASAGEPALCLLVATGPNLAGNALDPRGQPVLKGLRVGLHVGLELGTCQCTCRRPRWGMRWNVSVVVASAGTCN